LLFTHLHGCVRDAVRRPRCGSAAGSLSVS
jgi:hypothetical protein